MLDLSSLERGRIQGDLTVSCPDLWGGNGEDGKRIVRSGRARGIN